MYMNDLNKPIVISYENQLVNNANAKMFKKTLDQNNWEYLFIGENKKWQGVMDKIFGFYESLLLMPDNKIVILSDSRDVFCLREPEFFIEKVKNIIDTKIIVSTEMFLLSQMNWSKQQIEEKKLRNPLFFFQGKPLDNYWKFNNKENDIPFRKYANSGLIVGKSCNLIKLCKWIIDNNYQDDQLGVCDYINKYPELIHLDYDACFFHTSTFGVNGSLYNHSIQKQDTPTFSELLGFSCYFLHIPGIYSSNGQKLIYNILYDFFDKQVSVNMYKLYGVNPNINNENIYFITNDS